jgi:hypothetical protein
MNAERAAGLVRRWVGLYTRGLPAEIRQDRLDEIDDDLWSQRRDAAESDRPDQSLTGEIVMRLVFGIPADLSWRVEQRHVTRNHVAPERNPTTGVRAIALLAIVGGVGWVVWPIPQATVGREWPNEGFMPWLLFFSVVFGTWALAGATIGLVFGFQDRIREGAALIGSLGASIGAVSVLGLFAGIVALPLGSATLVRDLGHAGVLGPWQSRAHAVAAIIFFIPIVIIFANGALFDHPETAVPLMTLVLPYAFSWISIGWSLRHGTPVRERPAEGSG